MSQRNQGRGTYRRQTGRTTSQREKREYIYGSAVPKVEAPVRRATPTAPAHSVKKNRQKARYMSLSYVAFLCAAMCAAAFILINYIQLQSQVTQLTKTIASKEVELNNLKVANDEAYNRITSSVDLEEIKRIAIGELGMVYAGEGQIVTYTNDRSDYMRQVGAD